MPGAIYNSPAMLSAHVQYASFVDDSASPMLDFVGTLFGQLMTQNFFSLTTARRVFVAVVGTTACDVFEQGFNGPGPCYEFRVRFVFIV